MNRNIISALIGLTGAINNNGKTTKTDSLVCEALLCDDTIEKPNELSKENSIDKLKSDQTISEIVNKLHKEKYSISPSCETCLSPCGNTSDYPLEKFDEWTQEQKDLKEKLVNEAKRIAKAKRKVADIDGEIALPEIVYKAIAYLSYDLNRESYIKILEEMKLW